MLSAKKFRQKLERISELEEKIATEVKAIYEEHGKLIAEMVPEFIERKAPEVSGLLTATVSVKFKDGRTWLMKPNFVTKEGEMTNLIWKPACAHVYTITEKGV